MQPEQKPKRLTAACCRANAAIYAFVVDTSRDVAEAMNDAIYRGNVTPFYRECRDRHLATAEECDAKAAELNELADRLDALNPPVRLATNRPARDVLELSAEHRQWPPQESLS